MDMDLQTIETQCADVAERDRNAAAVQCMMLLDSAAVELHMDTGTQVAVEPVVLVGGLAVTVGAENSD